MNVAFLCRSFVVESNRVVEMLACIVEGTSWTWAWIIVWHFICMEIPAYLVAI